MKRKENRGEAYIEAFPRFKKWINECLRCHRKGYKPSMPEHIGGEYSMASYQIRKYFEPLELDADGICEYCKVGRKKKKKESSLADCLKYLEDNLQDLVHCASYPQSLPEFAQENAANDLAANWENCAYFIDRLYKAGKITQAVQEALLEIDKYLTDASSGGCLYEETIWATDALATHPFWERLRKKAETVLQEMVSLH